MYLGVTFYIKDFFKNFVKWIVKDQHFAKFTG